MPTITLKHKETGHVPEFNIDSNQSSFYNELIQAKGDKFYHVIVKHLLSVKYSKDLIIQTLSFMMDHVAEGYEIVIEK